MPSTENHPYPFSDLALARRLERVEGHGNARFVESRRAVSPSSGAGWIEVAGAYAMFDEVSSPITQTFGLGLFQKVTDVELNAIEAFYRERGAPVFHEISPLADMGVFTLLNQRGYQPFEFTSVLYRPIAPGIELSAAKNDKLRVRIVGSADWEVFAKTAARGWSEFTEYADAIQEMARIGARQANGLSFMAERDGQPIATGSMSTHDGVALLAGASTIPEHRKQGAQLALLDARLRYAVEQGCDLAMMGAAPGSASQRNAERHGFRIAYTRIKWRQAQPENVSA